MATYTYEQFEQAAKNSGLYNQFSSADLALAQQNPDAGMSILKYKQDYLNATTDEARALANLGAENIRSSYGNYKGGSDGSGFYLEPLSPSSFGSSTAPNYTNSYAGDIADLYEQQKNYGNYEYAVPAPEYTNRYDDTIQQMLGEIVNREEFVYDPSTDQLYEQYRKQYAREGQRATQDALGAAAAATGGIPSSYAQTAAGQAANYYAAQMTDKIPELYQLAYNKYLNDYNMQLSGLSAVQSAEQSDYDKYLTALAQYNTDKNFDYNAWLDAYNMISNNLNTATSLEQIEYNKFLNELNQYNADREFNYNVLLDEINSQAAERNEAYNQAQTDWEKQYNLALLAAEYGDYSGLQALGINVGGVAAPVVGSGGGGGGGGSFDNEGYDSSDIVKLQNALGVTPDGMFGSNSRAAMIEQGYNTIADAYAALVAGDTAAPGNVFDQIEQTYNGKELTQAEWDQLVAAGVSAADLQNNGFYIAGNMEENGREYQRLYNQIMTGSYNAATIADMIQRANLNNSQKNALLSLVGM